MGLSRSPGLPQRIFDSTVQHLRAFAYNLGLRACPVIGWTATVEPTPCGWWATFSINQLFRGWSRFSVVAEGWVSDFARAYMARVLCLITSALRRPPDQRLLTWCGMMQGRIGNPNFSITKSPARPRRMVWALLVLRQVYYARRCSASISRGMSDGTYTIMARTPDTWSRASIHSC